MIKGFWHIYCINHWYTIIIGQLRILLTSGLYDESQEINIGVVGKKEKKEFLERYLLAPYSKLKLGYWSENPKVCEFPTIQLIEQDNSPYSGFYFHTKSVTKIGDNMAGHWRICMEEEILNRWHKHYQNVATGLYDVSGMNFLKSPDHFSGNFFWFDRKYINKLPKVSKLDHTNRWQAEQWICMCPDKRVYSEPFLEPAGRVFVMSYNKSK